MTRLVTPLAALLLLGCGGGMPEAARTTERDSAGIHLVEHTGEPAPLPWRIDSVPRLDIGGETDDTTQLLFRVTRALRLADGRIVVGNGGTNELRFFDPGGRFVRSAGRTGEGPGEFRGLGTVFPYRGDSLLVSDTRLRRLSVFDGHGAFGRSFTVQTSDALPFASVIGVFHDGSLFGQGFVRTGDGVPSGLQRYDVSFYHLDTLAALLTALPDFPGTDAYFEAFDRGFRVHQALFGRRTWYLAAGHGFYVAANDRYELQRYRMDGTPDRVVRWARAPRPVTEQDVAAERARREEGARSDQARRDAGRIFGQLPRPDTFPAYGAVLVDDSLNLWVGDYVPGSSAPTRWTVFDAAGRVLGTVPNPGGFMPDHIGHDFLLGRWRDELDVEHVRLYGLDRRDRR
jgi:hypothetical protein